MEIIHSKTYSIRKKLFKQIFIKKNRQLFIQKIIHLEKNGNYSFEKLFS